MQPTSTNRWTWDRGDRDRSTGPGVEARRFRRTDPNQATCAPRTYGEDHDYADVGITTTDATQGSRSSLIRRSPRRN